jgi:uncharacterized membrane protein YdjX (TVP38/TMEM64 family)
MGLALAAGLAVVAGALWWLAPLDAPTLTTWVRRVPDGPARLGLVLGGFVALSLAMVPLTPLIVALGLLFDPLPAFAGSVAGSLLSAVLAFAAGRRLGRGRAPALANGAAARLLRAAGGGGVLAIALLRLVPAAPFTLVNLLAGASRVRARDFVLGTALGLTPGALLLTGLGRALAGLRQDPGLGSAALVLVLLAGLGIGALALRRLWARGAAGR